MEGITPMADQALLPDPTCLHLLQLEAEGKIITATVQTTAEAAHCPLCDSRSEKVHSHYVRVLADLPWMGYAVRLVLHVRRFFCTKSDCQRKIFTERVKSVVAPYARRTLRLTDLFSLIAFALGGEAGKRLAAGMGLSTSPDTLLQLIRQQAERPAPTPRVLGVDDFSFCRRRTYGTILIDLERRVPIEILPDREATTLAKWLAEHPGIEIISRDRGGPYAEGARLGAPEAPQIADRWHISVNLSEALKPFFNRKQTHLKALVEIPSEIFSEEEAKRLPPWYAAQSSTKKHRAISDAHHQARVERYHKVHELRAKGAEVTLLAHQTGLSRHSVYNYLRMEHPPERKRGRPGKPIIPRDAQRAVTYSEPG